MADETIARQEQFSIRSILPALLAILTGMLLVMLDSTVMNVAIPHLEKSFQTDLKTIQWAISGYTLALSAVIPLAGWFSDRFTAKKVILTSIFLFTGCSVLCAIAVTPSQLILFRILQGIGGGMIAPISMALSFKLAPPDKRGSVMGILGLPMLIAPIAGPVLSGWLLEYVNWQWIFLINVPIGIFTLAWGAKFLPDSNVEKRIKLDISGAILAPLSFSSLIYGVHIGGSENWGNPSSMIFIIVGLILLVIFILVEIRKEEPLLELRSFRSREFSKGVILTCLNWMALAGSSLLIPLYLQQVKGFTPFESGLVVIPQAILSFTGMVIGGKLFDRYGVKPVVFAGLVLLTTALAGLSAIQEPSNLYLLIGCISIMGLGQGLATMPLSTHVLKSAPEKFISRVTPLTTSVQQVFGSFAIAAMSGFLTTHIQNHTAQINTDLPGVQVGAMAAGFCDTFFLSMILAICGVIMSLFLRKSEVKSKKIIEKG
ncbi:MDR family MFS transporter [Paenibacillus tuaregi]|uniref:MDR family MFS transporter n=1 Tax=Paenibacillus tuaregi TaxID=1816681 RepID=UPI000838F954|nr:MDR family MFS transporter [Paenibacillus tuaregi]